MKRFLLFLVLVSLLLATTYEEAYRIASSWVEIINAERLPLLLPAGKGYRLFRLPAAEGWQLERLEPVFSEGERVGYVAHLSPAGFILIPEAKLLGPVKLYSATSPFMPSKIGFQKDVLRYLKRAAELSIRGLKPASSTAMLWRLLAEGDKSYLKAVAASQVLFGPMVPSRWGQDDPYNRYTPTLNGSHTLAGCVAVAFAQVMRFWSWPKRGRGSKTYYWSRGGRYLSASFDHDYYWDKMPSTLTRSSQQDEIDAVARLLYDVGVSVEMDYGLDGSAAYITDGVEAMPRYFKYSSEMTTLWRCSDWAYSPSTGWYCRAGAVKTASQWFAELRREVDEFEPFVFAIYTETAGHAVVVDGYKLSDAGNFIHVNMGWKGTADGFYHVDDVYGFRDLQWQHAAINQVPEIMPPRPANVKVERNENRGLFVREFWDEISWQPPPSGEGDLSGYGILRYDTNTGMIEFVGQVEKGQNRIFRIKVGRESHPYKYAVYAISKEGAMGKPTSFVAPSVK